MLNKVAGIDLLAVPYRGVAPALNDLLGGHIPVAIVSLATALPHLQSGRIRLLTVFDSKRYSKVPDVPAISEVLPDYHPGRAWVGFIGPPRLPPAIAVIGVKSLAMSNDEDLFWMRSIVCDNDSNTPIV